MATDAPTTTPSPRAPAPDATSRRTLVRGFLVGLVGYGAVQVALFVVRRLAHHEGRAGNIAIVAVAGLGLVMFVWATALLFEADWRRFAIGLMLGLLVVFAVDAIPAAHFALDSLDSGGKNNGPAIRGG